MSVCIAALTDDGKALVVAADWMATLYGGAFSADNSLVKAGNLVGYRWATYYAGDDIGRVEPVLGGARTLLSESGDPKPSMAAVKDALIASYVNERMKLATEMHLAIYGLDMTQFLSRGLKQFGQMGYGILRERIEHVSLEFSLLVSGFGPTNSPAIFEIDHPGVYRDRTALGYWAIGSGALAAIGRLSGRQQRRSLSVAQTIYNVYEAKMAAEGALGVGRVTSVFVVRPGEDALLMNDDAMRDLRAACAVNLWPPVPKTVLDTIEKGLYSAKSATSSSKDQT